MSDSSNAANIRGILLDVEGTTSAVAYVYDVMFPFARTGLAPYLAKHGNDEKLSSVKEQIAIDAGAESFAVWTADAADLLQTVEAEIVRLMDGDIKATGLKQLQGLIWEAGFQSGELRAHVYDDVAAAFARWQQAGLDLRIYSSGSIHAQKLFFGHSEAGDLLPHLSGHYDTTSGPKRESASYTTIASDWGLAPAEILFLSDVTEELDAARAAGMATNLVMRPGNAEPNPSTPEHERINNFADIP